MISFSFNIRNPFSKRFNCIWSKTGITPFKHKYWEAQIDKCADIIGFELRYTTRQDHAGVYVSVSLFGYDIIFNFYDTRHWDYENGCWIVYGK